MYINQSIGWYVSFVWIILRMLYTSQLLSFSGLWFIATLELSCNYNRLPLNYRSNWKAAEFIGDVQFRPFSLPQTYFQVILTWNNSYTTSVQGREPKATGLNENTVNKECMRWLVAVLWRWEYEPSLSFRWPAKTNYAERESLHTYSISISGLDKSIFKSQFLTWEYP